MGGPYEPFGDDGVAFIVDLEPSVVYQPRPGPLDHPTSREDLEAVVVDLLHHLDGDVVGSACGNEGLLEPAIAPDLRQSARTVPGPVHDSDPSRVVRHTGRHHDHRDEDPEGVDHAEGLPPGDLLAGVVSPGRAGDRGCSWDTTGIDDSGRGCRFSAFLLADHLGQAMTDPLPGSVLRPLGVIAVHGVPIRVGGGQGPPLTPGRRYEEDGVHDVSLCPLGGAPHATVPGVRRDQIGDQIPLVVGQITVHRPPRGRNGFVGRSHGRSIWDLATRMASILPFDWDYFIHSLSRPRRRHEVDGARPEVPSWSNTVTTNRIDRAAALSHSSK